MLGRRQVGRRRAGVCRPVVRDIVSVIHGAALRLPACVHDRMTLVMISDSERIGGRVRGRESGVTGVTGP